MMKIVIAAACLLTTITSSFACDRHGKTGFLPQNDLKIYAHQKSAGGITQDQFNQVIDKVEKLFSPIVSARGVKLQTYRGWEDPTVNAYAEENTPGVFGVHMFGGLARHETVTADGFALVMCHELGHHIGGAPKKIYYGHADWPSNEGQADYWGVMKCLRQVFKLDSNNIEIANKLNAPVLVVQSCRRENSSREDAAICTRTAMAGQSLANMFTALTKATQPATFTTPDKSVVTTTFDSHPKSQCRLDTYFQASLCHHSATEAVSDTDYRIGFCDENDTVGQRPKCWFAATHELQSQSNPKRNKHRKFNHL